MRQSQFTEEQMVLALRQAEAGTQVDEICGKLEINEATLDPGKTSNPECFNAGMKTGDIAS